MAERLEDLEAANGPDDLAQAALLLECAWRYRRSQRRQPTLPPLLRRALALMDEQEYFACGPADLAALVGCSREHLARLARRHLHRSLAELQSLRRLDHAARLLRYSDEPVTTIAAASGHGNLGHFYRCFRQRFGCAPGIYRKQYRQSPV